MSATTGKLPLIARPTPDCSQVHRELRRNGVTLSLLGQAYRAVTPEGYPYSAFGEHYRAWAGKRDLRMRQTQRAGEKHL